MNGFYQSLKSKTVTDHSDPTWYHDLPKEECSLKFRPPSAESLSSSTSSCLWEWTKVSLIAGAAFWAIRFATAYVLDSRMAEIVVSVFCGVAISVAFAPIADIRSPEHAGIPFGNYLNNSLGVVVAALLIFSPLHVLGTVVFCVGGTACVLISAMAMTHHVVDWHSSNPMVGEQTRICWLSATLSARLGLKSRNEDVRMLTIEAVTATCLVSGVMIVVPVAYLLLQWFGGQPTTWRILPIVILLLWICNKIWVTHSRSKPIFDHAMGHWLHYQPESHVSPLVFTSPTGSASQRTLLVWLSLTALTISGAALSSSIWSPELVDIPIAGRYIVALIDTTIAAICSPFIYWLSLRILTAPVFVAAQIRHDEEAGDSNSTSNSTESTSQAPEDGADEDDA